MATSEQHKEFENRMRSFDDKVNKLREEVSKLFYNINIACDYRKTIRRVDMCMPVEEPCTLKTCFFNPIRK